MAAKTSGSAAANVLPMSPAAFIAPAPVRQFVQAVLALSDNPGPENIERYLAASRALEDSSSSRNVARELRGLTKGRV